MTITTRVPGLTLRRATPADVPTILDHIVALAEYERAPEQVEATEVSLARTLFGPSPQAEVVLAEYRGEAAGFALFFHNYSTWRARHGLYLEDLYVREALRGKGIGEALLAYLGTIAVERDCARLEWSVLDWNTPAQGFYRALGAVPMDGWHVWRITGAALSALAGRF